MYPEYKGRCLNEANLKIIRTLALEFLFVFASARIILKFVATCNLTMLTLR